MGTDSTSFATLFKKYRLLSGFATIGEFADALAEEGLVYDNSLFSRWQRGTRVPQDRETVLAIIRVFLTKRSITRPEEINLFLESAGYGYLTNPEKKTLSLNIEDNEKRLESISTDVFPTDKIFVNRVFRHSFDNFPQPFLDKDSTDIVFVTGVGNYELQRLSLEDRKNRESTKAHKPCSEYIHLALMPLFGAIYKKTNSGLDNTLTHLSDVEVTNEILENHNIICFSGGDVNSLTSKICLAFEKVFHCKLPVYFTEMGASECIFSSLSKKYYSERDDTETGDQFTSFIVLIPNPWNQEKVILLAAGNRVLGTVAAIKVLTDAFLGKQSLTNHSIFSKIPMKIVVSTEIDKSRKRVLEMRFIE